MSALAPPANPAVSEALRRLLSGASLSRLQLQQAVAALLAGEATDAQVGAFSAVLRMRRAPETELAVLLEALGARMERLPRPPHDLLSCGTAGSEVGDPHPLHTGTALVSAAAGLPALEVVQEGGTHGITRMALLDALGIPGSRDADALGAVLERHGVAFAPLRPLLPGLKHLTGPRAELGFPNVFQVLATLLNPGGADTLYLGGHDAAALEWMARLVGRFGTPRCWVVRGLDGLDALSPSGPSEVAALGPDGHVRLHTVLPEDAGLELVAPGALCGSSPVEQARALRAMLAGEEGPLRTAVLLNAAGALLAAERVASLAEGATLAARAIDSGAAMAKLVALAER
ncbi:MAG TPA: anthranilate phosphoribosyltransferase [Myxococcaceae bacterium]|nr:anthranilate phosphoribosyltransferase [Myxococcaceae bacterium]